ncbi:MAG: FecR family protein [Bacteriovorax sp.]|nr:FecR family protein [Bacteriovorax sp.]
MKLPHLLATTILTLSFSYALFADEGGVAKVVIMKGQVKARLLNGSIQDVVVDQSIPEGATLQTSEKSFVKLIFIDKSLMNLGPNSQMVINAFPKNEAGIVTLVKGQIRSQVTKDYMEMDDKSKSKLYIKTKTAAMGIRGTDFQVNYNAENQNTSLITYEGKVAMAHIEKGQREDRLDQGKLERVVSSEKAVLVEHGQISAVNLNVAERAMAPTLLGTKQIEALQNNETGLKESTDSDKKQYRNPLPPGVDSAIFSSTQSVVSAEKINAKSNPNGFFNAKTGEYKLPAGSIIDLNTVNIIPPPANAVFDPNSKTYVVPENYGKVDKSTGEYKAPEGLKLGADGKFILVDPSAYAKSQVINKQDDKKQDKSPDQKTDAPKDERAPASTDAASAPTGPAPKMDVPKIYDARPDMAAFTERFAPAPPPPPSGMTDAQRAVAAERISTTETLRKDAADQGTNRPTAKTNFNFIPQ